MQAEKEPPDHERKRLDDLAKKVDAHIRDVEDLAGRLERLEDRLSRPTPSQKGSQDHGS